MTPGEVDRVLEIMREPILSEVMGMVSETYQDEFTVEELIAYRAFIRPIWERGRDDMRQAAPVVKLKAVRQAGAS